MVTFKKIVSVLCAASFLSACASRSDNISAAYVSPMQYSTYNCAQLSAEASRISSRAAQITGAQDSKATGDAVAMTVGLVIFWPALFFLKGDGTTAAEVARLKGEMEAIEQASVQKKCGIQFRKAADGAA
jgi:hypothetical protein